MYIRNRTSYQQLINKPPMPYRRLPNTDQARLKALKTAFDIGRELPPFKLAFEQSTLRLIHGFLHNYEKALIEYKGTYLNQVKRSKEYIQALKRIRLYISHFIQVLNMAITRGELQPSNRSYFGIDENDMKTPLLNSEASVIEWGERILKGEDARRNIGLPAVTNPTAAIVRVRYEKFVDAYRFQKTLQKDNKRSLDNLAALRAEADQIILSIWNEVEQSFKDMPDEERRKSCENYGITYVFRKNELQQVKLPETSQLSFF